jgi:long-subunit fatty acid transport protein
LLDPNDNRTADFKSFYMNEIIEWDLSGWDFTLGFLYLINNYTRFGATFKFPSYFKIEESYSIFASSEFGTGSSFEVELPSDKIKYNVRTPFEFSAGLSSKFKMIIFSWELKVMDYSTMEFTDGLGSDYRLNRNNEIDDLFRTAASGKVGAEVNLPVLPVRGRIGFIYNQSPYKGDGNEFDKKYLTLGAGLILGGKFSLDLGYAYGWWEDFGDNYGFNESRTLQKISVNKFLLSFSTRI